MSYAFIQNRDLSWLSFNQRVLEEAEDSRVPIFERLKYLSIYTNNLHEFFMIRVGSLLDILNQNDSAIDIRTNLPLKDVVKKLYKKVEQTNLYRDKIYEDVTSLLADKGVHIVSSKGLNEQERSEVKTYYKEHVASLISPQVIDENHPFPNLNNHQLFIGLQLKKKNSFTFGIIPIPEGLPPYLKLSSEGLKVILLEEILSMYAKSIFQAYDIEEKIVFMVSRNADLNWDEKADAFNDVRTKVKKMLQTRNRRYILRLTTSEGISSNFLQFLLTKFSLSKYQHFESRVPLKLGFVFDLEKTLEGPYKSSLVFPTLIQGLPVRYDPNQSMFKQIVKKDILSMYPYEKMTPFLHLIKEAASNPEVLSIKITVYRLGKTAKLVEYLSLAAENGKDVLVVIELRARFDEKNNIDWSERLEQAGCRIIYGLDYLKIHSKLCVITYQHGHQLHYITQIGTGNYNEKTVEQYTDISLITANPEIGIEAITFFQMISMNATSDAYQTLVVSPFHLKNKFLSLIEEEKAKGKDGYLLFKMNALTDNSFSIALAEASQAGVKIDLNIRGTCCLIPGLKGLTETVTVHSVIGRFLEHGRIYIFGKDEHQKVFIASADLMTRNTERRMEVGVPILDPELKTTLVNYVNLYMNDTIKGRRLNDQGQYEKILPTNNNHLIDAQSSLLDDQVRKALKNLSFLVDSFSDKT
jgi:polyphosphate kinase